MTDRPLLIKALAGEKVDRPPVWMMRQAGRYLPQYLKLRSKYDFFTRVRTPELACEITLQPIQIIGMDAAIIFSDILVIPQALGVEVLMVEDKGPVLPNIISSQIDIDNLQYHDAPDRLHYVYDALRLTKEHLPPDISLIGFAGAPFTILCYMVEGKGSKTFEKAKRFCFTQPALAHELLSIITNVTIEYLKRQVAAGADVIQVFDSWSGLLSHTDFKQFAQPYLEKIASALSPIAPVILFPKGSFYALEELSQSAASAIGIDWCISPQLARQLSQNQITLQGNYDPSKLFLPIPEIQKTTHQMIRDFGSQQFIANLGHGILPGTPVDHARAFVDAVKNYQN